MMGPIVQTPMTKGAVIGNRVLRNVISNWIGKVLWLISGFLLIPFILDRIGTAQFGLWALANSVMSYGLLLDFGIGWAVIKYVAEFRARGRAEDARALVATALRLYSWLGLAALVLSLAVAPLFPRLFNVPGDLQSEAIWVTLLMGVGLATSIPCTITTSVLRGLQRYDVVSLLASVATLLYAIGTVLVLILGGGLVGIVALSVAVTIVMQIPSISFIHRIAPDVPISWRGARHEWVRTVMSFGSWLFLMDVATRVQTKVDVLVIGAFLPISSVTPYALCRRLSEIGQIVSDQFIKVMLPLAAELKADDDVARLRELYVTGTRLTMALFLPIGCALSVLARPLLTLWVGAGYADYARLVPILVLATLLDTSQWTAATILQGIGRQRPLAIASACGAIANAGLSIILVRLLGLEGVAVSALIAAGIVCIGFVMPYAMRLMRVGALEVLKGVLLPSALPVIPALVSIYAVKSMIEAQSLFTLAIVAGVGLVTYWVMYLWLSASKIERETCSGFAVSAWHYAETLLRRS
jgi:O-antigen/teichoic acid export membrane protein